MTIGIYKLEFANTSKCYIGQSLNIEVRFKQHLNLMRKQNSSIKLNKAYLEYGNPILEILCECTESELNNYETEAIEIFEAVINGFNTCDSAGGRNSISGDEHGNSLYSNTQIEHVLKLLVMRLDLNFQEIYELTGVSRSVIAGISSLQTHKWLEDSLPEPYSQLEIQFKSGIRASTTKRGIKTESFALIDPTGVIHQVTNIMDFAKLHKLDKSHISKLYSGKRKMHKGWKMCPAL